jgi:hypothetical protein
MNIRWRMLDLPKIHDVRGNLTFIQNGPDLPFDIQRVYYLYDVPGGSTRAGHGHRELQSLIIAAAGSFDVHVDDGHRKETLRLDRANKGLLLDSMVWRVIDNFTSGSVCLVLASMLYDEEDYYRNYADFIAAVKANP